jgi:putative acetyltransferase
MGKVILRQYRNSDKDAAWQLHVDGLNQTGSFSFNPKLDADFKDIKGTYIKNGGEFFVASLDDIVIGMGALRKIDVDTAEIKRMRVSIKHQRKGLGSMILEKLIERAQKLGYKKLILDTSEKQNAAKQLYEKYGFQEYDRKKLGNHKTIFYELDLKKDGEKTSHNSC